VSRNLGLQAARGDYITFLDGDDVFRPEKVERQGTLISRHPAAMVYGPTLYWRQWAGAPSGQPKDTLGKLGVPPDRLYSPPELLKLFLSDGGTVPCICGLTVRRTVALEIGGFDARIHHMFEDQVFLAKICAKYRVFVESGCWDQYRPPRTGRSRTALTIQRSPILPTRPTSSG
jgi:GT2 family glycosyltransferase